MIVFDTLVERYGYLLQAQDGDSFLVILYADGSRVALSETWETASRRQRFHAVTGR